MQEFQLFFVQIDNTSYQFILNQLRLKTGSFDFTWDYTRQDKLKLPSNNYEQIFNDYLFVEVMKQLWTSRTSASIIKKIYLALYSNNHKPILQKKGILNIALTAHIWFQEITS